MSHEAIDFSLTLESRIISHQSCLFTPIFDMQNYKDKHSHYNVKRELSLYSGLVGSRL
jgi:hypothetical protein